MATEIPTDAQAFLLFLADELKNGSAEKSPEELLQTWRAKHSETIDDVRQGIRDLEAGQFRSFEEVDLEIRNKFGFSSKQG